MLSGISRWNSVYQRVRWTATPAPAQNAAIESSHTEGATIEDQDLPGERYGRDRAGDERTPGTDAQGEHTAGDRADTPDGDDRPPRTCAAEVGLGDHGPEHDPGTEAEIADPEQDDRRPQPGARGERLPAGTELVDESLARGVAGTGRDPDALQDHGAHDEAQGVDAQRGPGAPDHDQQAADRGPEDPRQVAAQPLERVGLLEPGRADGLGHETDLGGDDEPAADAVDPLQQDDRDDRAAACEDEGRRSGLGGALQEGGAAHHEIPRQPIGEHAAPDEHERLGDLSDREHHSEIGRRADVEHGEGECDPGDPVADGRDHRPAEQQPEVPLREGTQVLPQPRHDRGSLRRRRVAAQIG